MDNNLEKYINKVICGDCLDIMKELPDKCIDLVLTDPPYGINIDKKFKLVANTKSGKSLAFRKDYDFFNWDNPIEKIYFDEIIRISKNQIIFGGEHICLNLPKSRGWIVWDKLTGTNNYGDCELAWSSYNKPISKFTYLWKGMLQQNMKNKEFRFHPTQKPLALMKWCIRKSSNENDLILDPFLGSGTTGVACKELNRRFIGIEINKKYCEIAEKRIANARVPLPGIKF